MFTVCNNCRYFVDADDEVCFNCGVSNPAGNPMWANFSPKRSILLFFALFAIISLIIFISQGFNMSGLFSGFFIACAFAFVLENVFSSLQKASPESLLGKENVITKRLEELKQRNRNVHKVLNQITENDTKQLQGVKTKLLSAREIIENQTERYELQQRKIDLIREQNKIKPYISNFQSLDATEIENGLNAIAIAKSEVKSLNKLVSDKNNIELSNDNLPERNQFIRQLKETESAYSKLRESLISKQATNALKGVSDLGETAGVTNQLEHTVETFHANAEISDFSESFEELESEYKRLKIENDISDKLLTE